MSDKLDWEYFSDASYYDKWAVRNKTDRKFHSAIHVATKEEAEFLVGKLNGHQSLIDALEEAKNYLVVQTGVHKNIVLEKIDAALLAARG